MRVKHITEMFLSNRNSFGDFPEFFQEERKLGLQTSRERCRSYRRKIEGILKVKSLMGWSHGLLRDIWSRQPCPPKPPKGRLLQPIWGRLGFWDPMISPPRGGGGNPGPPSLILYKPKPPHVSMHQSQQTTWLSIPLSRVRGFFHNHTP
jgi:hypothetical protein